MGLLARNSKAPIVLFILPKCTWDNDDFSHNKDTAASIRSKIISYHKATLHFEGKHSIHYSPFNLLCLSNDTNVAREPRPNGND